MQALPIILLIWLYAVAIIGFIDIMLTQANIGFSSTIISIILSILGVSLGLIFYLLSLLKSTTKMYITISAIGVILLLILAVYLIGGLGSLVLLGIIAFFFVISSIPLIAVYSLLKSQKMVFFASAIGLIVFYFILVLLDKIKPDTLVPLYSETQLELLLLFFVLFICFVELGSSSIYFKNSITKMIPNKNIDESMIKRYNQVFNNYIVHMSIFLVFSYIVTIFLLWNANVISINNFMDIDLNSAYGIILLVCLILIGAFIFWFFIPREKTTKNTFNNPRFSNINEK